MSSVVSFIQDHAAPNSGKEADTSCFHCGLPITGEPACELEIDKQRRPFCCPGCQMVCRTIYDAGLEGFYERVNSGTLAPPTEQLQNLSHYDLDEVQAEFVSTMGRQRSITLLIEGIHCAACVWLIERALNQIKGVLEARVNLTNKRLLLSWNNEEIKLSPILLRLAQIGYPAVPYDPDVAAAQLKKQNRALLLRMAFAGFTMMNLLWISVALYSGAAQSEFRNLFHWVGFFLATPTLFYSGFPFLRNALTGLWRAHLSMDLPISIGAISTYCYSVYVTVYPYATGEVYYDTLVNFLFVILVGRYLEAISRQRALASTQRLVDLQPRSALVKRSQDTELLPIRAVKTDDIVIVKPGELIPVDGCVVEGNSHVNESLFSGETRPMTKRQGDKVSAGTLNMDNVICVRVQDTLQQTALGRIIHRVEDAQASKAPIQCTTDRIVPWFVATTLALALVTFLLWQRSDIELALMAATSVLIITCPCAFGLATPMSIAVASGIAARNGILVKNAGVLESLSQIDHMVFDKTGTLTEGQLQVQEVLSSGKFDQNTLIAYTATLEAYSEHHMAKAICDWANTQRIETFPLVDGNIAQLEIKPGLGIKGRVNKRSVIVGSSAWLKLNHIALPRELTKRGEELESNGMSCVYVAIDAASVGLIALQDQLRPDAIQLVQALRDRGIRMCILSGDRATVVNHIARQLGGLESIAEVLPQDKDRVIQQLRANGLKVAMVGDGVNDAAALSLADIGIVTASGTDISADSADIVLMSNQLMNIQLAMQLSERTRHTIWQNILISFCYNLIMVPLAMLALITPLVAALSMPISSLLVIGNAARIATLFNRRA